MPSKLSSDDLMGTHTGTFMIGVPSGVEGVVYPFEAISISPLGSMISVTGPQAHILVEQIWFLDKDVKPGQSLVVHVPEVPTQVAPVEPPKQVVEPPKQVVEPPKQVVEPPKQVVEPPAPPRILDTGPSTTDFSGPLPFQTTRRHEELASQIAANLGKKKTRDQWEKHKEMTKELRTLEDTREITEDTDTPQTPTPPSGPRKRKKRKGRMSRRLEELRETVLSKMKPGVMYSKGDLCPDVSQGVWAKLRTSLIKDGTLLSEGHGRGAKVALTAEAPTPPPEGAEVHSSVDSGDSTRSEGDGPEMSG